MVKIKTTALAFAAGACLIGFSGENLLKNGDFECGNVAGWGNRSPQSTVQVVSEGAHGGKRCLSYTHAGASGTAFLVNGVPVASNGVYTVSGWIKGAAGSLGIRLFHYDCDRKYLGEELAYEATSLDGWTRFERVFKTPARAASVYVGLQVSRGTAYLDDVGVEAGNRISEVPNEILNSSYTYTLHDGGMPEQWNTYSGYTFNTFRPGVHEGRYFRMADDTASPVKGARTVFVEGVYATSVRMGPLAGGQDYVFSLWAKSDSPAARLSLKFAGRTETFALDKEWRRCVMKAHLAKSQREGSAMIVYGGHALYYAAPMLHAGVEPLPWKPNPSDGNLPDLRSGGQTVVKTAEIRTFEVPEAADRSGAKILTDFHPLPDFAVTESSKYRMFVRRRRGTLFVDVECDSGKKPAVKMQTGKPLVLGNDAVELFVSSSGNGSPFIQFMGGRNGASAATRGAQGVAVDGGWTYRAVETGKGWRAEFGLPLALFDKPDGECWRFNAGVTDFDGAKPRYYSAIRGGFHASGSYMRLTGMPRGVRAGAPRIAAEFDFCTGERTVRAKVMDAEGEATASLYSGGAAVATAAVRNGEVSFDISALPEGCCEIVVKAANGTAKTHFRKAARGTRHTRINRFKLHLEMDGKAFFPVVYSWYNLKGELPTKWHIDELKSRNFNTIMPMPEMWAPWARSVTPEFRRKTMRIFADAGFKFIVWSRTSHKKGLVALSAERAKHIEEFAEFRQDILGWYYVDEIAPMWETAFNVRREEYPAGYCAIKNVDPARLHFINWNWTTVSDGMPFYAEEGATDFYSLDSYPYSHLHYGYGALQAHERVARILNGRTLATSKPGIIWLQTYGTNEGFREPLPVEYRNNVYVGLVNHIVGYMNFIGCPEHKDLWDEMGRSYGTALKWLDMTAHPESECIRRGRDGNIVYALWKNGRGGYALVAANLVYAKQSGRAESVCGGNVNLIGGEGELSIVPAGFLDISLPSAGSAAWFIEP